MLMFSMLFSQNQSYFIDNFQSGLSTNWKANSIYSLAVNSGVLEVNASAAGGPSNYNAFTLEFAKPIDMSNKPYIQFIAKTSVVVNVRIDLIDSLGKSTNANPVAQTIELGNSLKKFTYSYLGKFNQSWPTTSTVSSSKISKVMIFFDPNATGYFTGKVTFDNFKMGDSTDVPMPDAGVAYNQTGYYTNGPKTILVLNKNSASNFYITNLSASDTLYRGTLSSSSTWNASGDNVKSANFSSFNIAGDYIFDCPGVTKKQIKISEERFLKTGKALNVLN